MSQSAEAGSSEPLVELIAEDPRWLEALPDLAELAEQAATLALEAAGHSPDRWHLALLACSDARIAELNAEFRGKDAATDVLSWPAFAVLPADPAPRTHLGDLALSLETTTSVAAVHAIPLKDRVLHLILHGCLHLLGYDHSAEQDAREMEDLERRALGRIGLPDPYGEGEADDPRPKE